jgi:trans-aconitate methyltransferase
VTSGNRELLTGGTFTVPPDRRGRLVAVVLQRVDASKPWRVLDLGCGTGLNLFALAEALPYATLTGVDISAPSIARAEAARRRHPAAARMTFASADYLTFEGSPYDLIVSETVLHTIPVPTDTLFGKIGRDVAPGGLLIYTMPTAGLGNRLLAGLRRLLRAGRGGAMDAVVLAVARMLHGRQYDDALLQERIPYMYLIPDRYDTPSLHRHLRAHHRLEVIATEPVPRASPAQLAHRLVVARKI